VNTIHLATADGKNARVPLLRPRRLAPKTVKVTPLGEEVLSKTVHRGNAPVDPATLTARALVEGDPEIDLANIGRIIPESSRAYRIQGAAQLEGNFQVIVTRHAPDGAVTQRGVYTPPKANINDVSPIRMGQRVPLGEIFRRYVFHHQYYLAHADGLQHEFLLAIARELEAAGEAAKLEAGPKGKQPLVFRNGGVPTAAFLVGETDGDGYLLRVMLTRMELKVPAVRATPRES
jgi:hypothetical protein